jgi:hypothetical protein
VLLAKCYQSDIIKEDEMKEACSTQGKMVFYSESLKGKEHLGHISMETIKISG